MDISCFCLPHRAAEMAVSQEPLTQNCMSFNSCLTTSPRSNCKCQVCKQKSNCITYYFFSQGAKAKEAEAGSILTHHTRSHLAVPVWFTWQWAVTFCKIQWEISYTIRTDHHKTAISSSTTSGHLLLVCRHANKTSVNTVTAVNLE